MSSNENMSSEVNPYAEEFLPLSEYCKSAEVSSASSKELTGGNMAERVPSHSTSEPTQADVTRFVEIAQKLEQELQAIVIGQVLIIRELLLALFAGGHPRFGQNVTCAYPLRRLIPQICTHSVYT
jgi:hypothetical protein